MTKRNHLHNREKWERELQDICFQIRNRKHVIFTNHFLDSLKERELEVGEVYSIFKNGTAEIIQGHAVGTYALNGGKLNTDEIRVFYGKTKTNKIIHVVMAVAPGKFKFVTVYFPSLQYFEENLKTLRKEYQFKKLNFLDD
ncbi:DUF4258 domain-containing protein [Neobacillus sp. YIM B02564]|uniref:DUF4258 domain-containing protein n=1 Tax=Neobacillus paridis TaxID=2803862 RepID=A0ABS1TMD1_9BACI|nr:DUF4258 domain-containing protein [Neobacillus paridis]MBL4952159.1 DUF4258 domain-containing protein [Neobacillus paridis]